MLINNLETLRLFARVSPTFNFQDLANMLLLAEEEFIAPEIGADMLATIIDEADTDVEPMARLVVLVKNATVNYALWKYVPEGEIMMNGGNISRAETAEEKSMFQYQKTSLETSLMNKAYSFMELALGHAEKHAAVLQWDAPAYTEMQGVLLPTAVRFTDFMPALNGSRFIYRKIKEKISRLQGQSILANVGEDLLTKLLTYNKQPYSNIPLHYNQVYSLACRALSLMVWAEAVPELSFMIDERGMSKLSGGRGQLVNTREAVAEQFVMSVRNNLEANAQREVRLLRNYLQKFAEFIPEYLNSELYVPPGTNNNDQDSSAGAVMMG